MLRFIAHFLSRGAPQILKKEIAGFPFEFAIDRRVAGSKKILIEVSSYLDEQWSKFSNTLSCEFRDYGHPSMFPPIDYFVELLPTTSDCFMGDQSTLILRFHFPLDDEWNGIPCYDFFINEDFEIVHNQAVF